MMPLRNTYKSSFLSHSNSQTLNHSLHHTNASSLENSVNLYIEKIESKKKKLFGLGDLHRVASRDNSLFRTRLLDHKKEASKQVKVKNLNKKIEKMMINCNETLAFNERLRQDINKMRMSKNNMRLLDRGITDEIMKKEAKLEKNLAWIEKQQELKMEKLGYIEEMTTLNKRERELHETQIKEMGLEYGEKCNHQAQVQSKNKSETVDTQAILRNRLKNVISKNKRTLQHVVEYQKILKQLEFQFEEIISRTSIEDIAEVVDVFSASYQQISSIYNHITNVSGNVHSLETHIKTLTDKITAKEAHAKSILADTTKSTPSPTLLTSKTAASNQGLINRFQNVVLQNIRDPLRKALLFFSSKQKTSNYGQYKNEFSLNQHTLEGYLSDLELYVNEVYERSYLFNKHTPSISQVEECPRSLARPMYTQDDLKEDRQPLSYDRQLLSYGEFSQLAQQFVLSQSRKPKCC